MNESLPSGISHPLPDVLRFRNNARVTGAAGWSRRRAELLALFESEVYGPAPPPEPPRKTFTRAVASPDTAVALRIETWNLGITGPVQVLLAAPARAARPVPAFVGLNFVGADETAAGSAGYHWALVEAAKRGFATVVAGYEESAPDHKGAPTYAGPYRAISLWAWTLSRLADGIALYAPEIDPERLAVVGHSRLGKTALLAGARDTRFKLVIPSQSGCGGAAPSRSSIGESVARINSVFPHWFCDRFKKYGARPEKLPLDQHGLLACIAPRALLLCNAVEDSWANPDGQRAALEAARPVWSLLGASPTEQTGTFIRPGKHAMTEAEWSAYLEFAEKCLR